MKVKYALTSRALDPNSGQPPLVAAMSYSSFDGRLTRLDKNVLGQLCAGYSKKPLLWSSAEKALSFKSAESMRDPGCGRPVEPSTVEVGPSNEQLREAVMYYWGDVVRQLAHEAETSPVAQELLDKLVKHAWDGDRWD